MTALQPQEPPGEPLEPAPVTLGRRLQLNPQALKLVPAEHRRAWEDLGRQVQLDIAGNHRRRWSDVETLRVILAGPEESYADVAEELDRSPGAIRYRRQAMIHLLREEHGARERADAYRQDPKANHKHHDYFQVDEALRNYGFQSLPVAEQFAMAQPLRQPTSSWRGDGTSKALAAGTSALREDVQRLLREARGLAQQGTPAQPVASDG